ncbi:MAG: peptidoglycan-binding protein [Pseudomonadota bacterium]
MSASVTGRAWKVLVGFAVGLSAVLAIGLGATFLSDPAQEDSEQAKDIEPPVETPTAVEPSPGEASDAVSDAAQPSAPPPDAVPEVSTFRLDPDGQLLIAGRSPPGWETTIRLDSDVIATFLPEANGEFVQFLSVDPSAQARILSLSARSPDTGEDIASGAEIIIAPLPKGAPEDAVASSSPSVDAQTPNISDEAGEDVSAQTTDAAGADLPPTDATQDQTSDVLAQETALSDEDAAGGQTSQDASAETENPGNVSEQTAVLLSDEDGIRVLQAPGGDTPPEVMSEVALDTITYSQEGAIELSGRATGDGFVRIYVDNAPVITSRVQEGGQWRSELPELASGVYTLRIDEVTEDGNVLSRVETPFQREDEQVLADAMSSGQGVQAITVQPGFTLWGISRERYGDGFAYVRIFEANRDLIRDPDLIYPGQVFSLPQ